MTSWLARQALHELWSLVWHFGGIAFVGICAVAWAVWVPVFKKTALWVALCAAIIFVTAGVYTNLGASYVHEQWRKSIAADVKDAEEVREDAEISVPPVDPSGHIERLPNDQSDRANR